MSVIDEIEGERRRIADFVATLSDADLSTQSLCASWNVREVAQHLLMPLVTSLPVVAVAMVRARFDFDRANLALTARLDGRSADELARGLRIHARHGFTPPGMPHEAPLTDLIVHGQDMARPLRRSLAPPLAAVLTALSFTLSRKGRAMTGVRVDGLAWRASDADWGEGEGAEVRGSALDLLLAATGRACALDDLRGAGVAPLATRLDRR